MRGSWAKIAAVSSLRQSFALRPLEIKHIFDFAIRLLRSGFSQMFLATAMVQLPLALLTMPLLLRIMRLATDIEAMANEGSAEFLSSMFWAEQVDLAVFAFIMLFVAMAYQVLITPLGNLICARLAACRLLGVECSFGAAWDYAKRHYWPTQVAIAIFLLPLLLLSLLVLVVVLVAQATGSDTGVLAASGFGILFISLGGAATMLYFCSYFPAINGIIQASEEPEGQGILARGLWCLRRAAELTKGHFWRMLGMLLFLSIIINYISQGMSESVRLLTTLVAGMLRNDSANKVIENFVTGTPESWELGVVLMISSLFALFFPPFWQCYKTLLYYDLRCRKEAFDLKRQLGLPEARLSDETLVVSLAG
jgi:hypothetical protein